MQYTQQVQLPVPVDRVDGTTFNQNLPNNNDIWPQLQIPQGFEQIAGGVVANFRMHVQTRHNKSPLHTFAYNLLAQNRFNNPLFQEWCQRGLDFCEFLMRAQNNHANDAVPKAAAKIYLSYLAVVGNNYPQVAQMLQQNMIDDLIRSGQEYNDIQRDIQTYKAQRAGGMQNGYTPQGHMPSNGMLPPINMGGGHAAPSSMQSVLSTYAPSQAASMAPMTQPTNYSVEGGRKSGMFLEPTGVVSKGPQSWEAGKPLAGQQQAATAQRGGPVTPVITAETEVHEAFAQTVDELKIDPYFYQPKGFVIDPTRPFDEIHNPGGIEIRPAHLTKWKWTPGDDQPYRVVYDHEQYILFYAKWPDGRVKEVVVANKPEMEYLLHEINDELRAKAIRPKGLVVSRLSGIIDNDKAAQPAEVVSHEKDTHLDDIAALSPVILDRVFSGNTDLEDQREARREVMSLLELPEGSDMPAHEYRSFRFHPMEVAKDTYEILTGLKDYKSFESTANKIQNMLDNNLLPIREYRFLDRRLTEAVNAFLMDSLSISGITIDSFLADIKDLGPYLEQKKGLSFQKTFDASVGSILGRALAFSEVVEEPEGDEEPTTLHGVSDLFVNFQVGWSQQDLENLHLSKEPVLLSQYTHPRIVNVVTGIVKRADAGNFLKSHRLRIITADGIYYEIIRGKLLDKALLLKQL